MTAGKSQYPFLKTMFFLFVLGCLLSAGCEKNSGRLPCDADGNFYDTVIIGTQTWLAENLKTTRYLNGTSIPMVRDGAEWKILTSPALCLFDNHADFKNTYGFLYNWYAVNQDKLCPYGYHVPSVDDWSTLISFLGGGNIAGGKLKEAGLDHWQSPNTGATNSTGFTALAAGQRNWDGTFNAIGNYCWLWTSTAVSGSEGSAYKFSLDSYGERAITYSSNTTAGYPVRCVKDN